MCCNSQKDYNVHVTDETAENNYAPRIIFKNMITETFCPKFHV